jgi:1-acyl-sn-glycerol-3-phosphate acyltransferase
MSRIGAVFAERFDTRKGIDAARGITEIARAGRASLFFAEGTFTRMPGLLPFHMGAFVAAAETNTPVVPIAIRGTRSILRADSWFPRHGAITVFVGEPIYPDAMGAEAGESAWTRGLKIRDRARREILRYCGEPDLGHELPPLWTGTPADAPKTEAE